MSNRRPSQWHKKTSKAPRHASGLRDARRSSQHPHCRHGERVAYSRGEGGMFGENAHRASTEDGRVRWPAALQAAREH